MRLPPPALTTSLQVLRESMAIREFNDQGQVNKTTIMTRILQLVHELCIKGIHVTKRDMFYTDVKLFEVRTAGQAALPCSRRGM